MTAAALERQGGRLPLRPLLLVGGAASAIALRMWDPAQPSTPTICPFRLCTGHACPGCGLTRATAWLARGDVAESVRVHPLAPVIVAQLVLLWIWAVSRKPSGIRRGRPAVVVVLAGLNAVALVLTWLVRWRTGSLTV
jgi:hypothetical protein